MQALLRLSRAIDALNEKAGHVATWLVLVATLISAGNAFMRWGFNASSNAWLEVQWYLFAGMVMLGAAHTLRLNEHVRVDVFYSRYSERARAWLDLLGAIFFLLPMTVIIGWLSWPLFAMSYEIGEVSGNAGGLVRWPAKILLPVGFLLLTLQGVSEIIKRAAVLTGRARPETDYARPLQ